MTLTFQQALDATNRLYRRLDNRRGPIEQRDCYYRGDQPLRFASDVWREYHSRRYEKFSDNWCAPVANSPSERLRIDGFRLSDDPQTSQVEKQLWNDWLTNNMEMQASQGLLTSIIAARSYVIVWADSDGQPLITWEQPDQVIVDYAADRPGRRVSALKTWCDDNTEYATLYTPDYLWKWRRQRVKVHRPMSTALSPTAAAFYYTSTAGVILPNLDVSKWSPRPVEDSGDDAWPLPNPIGEVPVVEFPNRPLLGGRPLSEIDGTIAMQDAINLLWAYLFTAADFASMPARVVLGQEPPKIPILDESGQKVGERPIDLKKLAQDRLLWLTGENTKIGQWDPASLDVFTNVVETGVSHVAAQTRTPPHYLILGKGLVNVNADGMRAAEAGLVMKVREEQSFLGPSAREVFRLQALVRGQPKVAARCRLGVVQWRDAENRSEAQLVDALQKLQAMGFPFQWIAERYGLSQTEITRVLAMRQREQEEDPVAAISKALGQVPPQPSAGPPPGE